MQTRGLSSDPADLEALVQNLIGIISLPAIWRGGNPAHVAGTLLDVLIEMMDLDFAYAGFPPGVVELPLTTIRVSQTLECPPTHDDVARLVDGLVNSGGATVTRQALPSGDCAVVHLPLGLHGQAGLIVAGSRRLNFPQTVDTLLLRIAANQAAVGLQESLLLLEQKRRAATLEVEVSDRTSALRREIEERVAVEAKLREALAALGRSEAFLKRAQRLSSTGSWYWKVTADRMEISDETYAIFAWDVGSPVTVDSILKRVHPEDLDAVRDTLGLARDHCADIDLEFRACLPDGKLKHLHLVGHGTSDVAGMVEYIGAVQDVTQRRQAQEAIEKARSELAHAARVTTVGALAASIAHEINQPLTSIRLNATTCVRMMQGAAPDLDRALELVNRTIRDSKRASDVIDRLKSLLGKKQIAFQPIEVNDVVRDVMALSSMELQRNHVRLHTRLSETLPKVMGDRVQLQQVVLNLVLNAIDAMKVVDHKRREIVITTASEHADVRLSVEDAGVGLDEDAVERLFEAFYTTKSTGMGIGLWVSRSIVESHGGRLNAAPRDGGGAQFTVRLPRLG